MQTAPRSSQRLVTSLLVASTALALGACGGGDDPAPSVSFVIRTTPHAVSSGLPPIVDGGWMAYLAREFSTGPGGTDLNGNTLTNDDVPVVVDMATQASVVMGEAAFNDQLELWNGHLWFVADETTEGEILNGDADMTDTLLMHWTAGMTAAEVVTDLDPLSGGSWMQWSGDKLYFPRANFTPAGDETTLAFVTVADPTTPVVVGNQVGGGTLQPRILGEADDLLFLYLDEVVESANLNASGPGTDTDMTDGRVLALIDLTVDAAPLVKNTGVAISSVAPFTAVEIPGNDYVVAFLVDEASQGPADLNDPNLFDPAWRLSQSQCTTAADGDMTDQVLFTLPYQSWLMGLTTSPINTGLTGEDRVVAMDGYVGTLVPELEANCDLNVDSDTSDRIFRWTSTILPIVPPSTATDLHAVATMASESQGVAVLDGEWVIAVDEMLDSDILNNDGLQDDVLLAHIPPTGATGWEFTMGDIPGSPTTFTVGVDWLAAEEQNGSLPVGLQESEWGSTLNTECSATYDDGDFTDVLPVWTEFDGSVLRVFRLRFAARTGNPGTVVTPNWVFTRLSESEHGKILNGDADLNDAILIRNTRGLVCNPVAMGTASDESGSVIHTRDGAAGAAYVASEQQAGVDLNGDGDATPNDLVVRWFVY